jgi:dolichyl-phosphate-mannose--protein O-mannosyl transferase
MRRLRRWLAGHPWEFWFLTGLGVVTRGWGLTTPADLVWDERHYAYFIGAFLNRSWMMDVHPPLGRILLAAVAWVEGYGPDLMSQQVGAAWVRVLPAAAGALLVPVIWHLVRTMGGGRIAAAVAAGAVTFDLALLVESRYILPESMLLLAMLASISCALASGRTDGPRARVAWWVAAAVLAGASVSIKWTGLAATAILLVLVAGAAWRRHVTVRRAATGSALLVGIVGAVYLASFAAQFALLTDTGREDHWMSPAFTKTLEGSMNHVHGSRMPFLSAVAEMHRVMLVMNDNIAGQGGGLSSSPWYTWPISKHSITLLQRGGEEGAVQQWIVMTGNPVVWWGAVIGMLLALGGLALAHRPERAGEAWAIRLRERREAMLFLTVAWAINFVPFTLITRPMYLYHYFAALLFSIMLAAIGAEALLGWTERRGRFAWSGMLVASAVAFAYLAPMAYGWQISRDAARHRRAMLERGTPFRGSSTPSSLPPAPPGP